MINQPVLIEMLAHQRIKDLRHAAANSAMKAEAKQSTRPARWRSTVAAGLIALGSSVVRCGQHLAQSPQTQGVLPART